jgi:hypothetical protein
MSTILKALRRLEEQRRVIDEENLRERILASPERDAAPPSRLRSVGKTLLLTLAAGIVLAAASFGVWSGLGEVADSDAASHAETPAPEGGLASRAAEGSRALPSGSAPRPSASEAASAAAVVATPAATPQRPPVARVSPVPAVSAPPPTLRPVASGPKLADDIALITRPPKPTALPVEARSSPVAAPKEFVVIATAPDPLPVPAKLAAAAPPIRRIERAPFPEFTVKRIEWHPRAARRVVLIDTGGAAAPRPYGEGENLGVLEIVEITPTAVLFRRDGVEIRRAVGH